jgi:hypothetical protein
MAESVVNEIDRIFQEAIGADKNTLTCEWTGVESVVASKAGTVEHTGWIPTYTKEDVVTVSRDGDLLLGIFSDVGISFSIRIGGQDCLGGTHVLPLGGGYLPLKVPMICWHYSMMHVVCDRPAKLTLVYGMILDTRLRRTLAQLGAFHKLPSGRTMVYKGYVRECDDDEATCADSMIELKM